MQSESRHGSFVVSLMMLLVVLGALWQRQAIYDWYRLRGYEPSAAIASLAESTTMSDDARHIFYVHHPVLEDKQSFNKNCTNTESSIVLGCYISGQGIFIYDVTDERLSGIEEVTAAHEMLHAAYDRLSAAERKRIDGLTQQAFEALNDKRINDTVQRYKARDAEIVPNELHSILGTEVRELPKELENYYARYFRERAKVVSLSEQYQEAFTERQSKIDSYDQQLKDLQAQIDRMNSSLEAQDKQLDSERERLDRLRSSGQTQSYNAAVPGFNELVRRYNASVAETRRLIEQYNLVVAERNALAVEENELIKAIDSRPSTLETQ